MQVFCCYLNSYKYCNDKRQESSQMKEYFAFGKFDTIEKITPDLTAELVAEAQKIRHDFRRVPLVAILTVLDRVSRRLADPEDPYRQEALRLLPDLIGFTPEMIGAGIDTLCSILQRENLETRLQCDLGNASFMDEYVYHDDFKGYMRAMPLGVIAHVAAGNVFVGAVDSLIQGILTKNISLLKLSSNDPVFPLLFAKVVKECDPEGVVSRSFALLPFAGGEVEIERILKLECDGIIVYGGREAVEVYRSGLGPHTKLIEYGPKYSTVFVDADVVEAKGLQKTARTVARDFTMWEQSACSSPHTVFVRGTQEQGEQFARALADAINTYTTTYPPCSKAPNTQAEILKERETALVRQAMGQAECILPESGSQDWTVIFEKIPEFRVSCQFRSAFVTCVDDFSQALEILQPYGKFLQSAGILADQATLFELAESFAAVGGDRVVEIGNMARRKHGSPHDGTRALHELVRWVSIGKPSRFKDPFDYLPQDQRDERTLLRLNDLLHTARTKAPFRQDLLPEKPLTSLADIRQIPELKPQDLQHHLYPHGQGALTAPLGNSYTFGSGGTTGQAKFFHRTVPETLHNAKALAKGLAWSILEPGDIVANLLFAGNLWASFISYNQALEYLGCHILPVSSNVDMESMANIVREFKADSVITIPSVIISLSQWVEKNNITGLTVKKVITGGEHLFPQAKEYISRILQTEQFASTGYTTNDTGVIGIQCEKCTGGMHHLLEDMTYIEIVDPETGAPMPDGEPGKILVTNLHRTLMPTIRYDIGDTGRIIPQPCSCGRSLRLMELLGRSDEVLIIGGGNVRLESVASAIAEIDGLSYHFRMIARLDGMLDLLEVEVESRASATAEARQAMADGLYASLMNVNQFLPQFLQSSSIAKPVIHVLEPDSLPRNPRTGKIRQVLDKR